MDITPADVAEALLKQRPDYVSAIGLELRKKVQLVDARGAMAVLSLGRVATETFLKSVPCLVFGERSRRWRLADIDAELERRAHPARNQAGARKSP